MPSTPSLPALLTDAKLALETIEINKSPVFRKAAAEFLQTIAAEMAASIITPSAPHQASSTDH
jgi:hypothetical protein